ncbi:discoidin domain-containing protein [Streptomyces sp. HD]|uniref:discoidin domain-containing protein n=1 Tax=Streptomyces sp. HD TaxID=3020892 RepID=UPI00232FB849|nr:discoidin domain-containing protein [Streptomyces sp. HD]MDC0773524.1 discoidin domain-containing protein [Streptomyces sp. HD]
MSRISTIEMNHKQPAALGNCVSALDNNPIRTRQFIPRRPGRRGAQGRLLPDHLRPGRLRHARRAVGTGGRPVPQVTRVFDVATGADLAQSTGADGKVTATGISRTRIPEDSIIGVTLDRSVVPADIAAGQTATASSEESSKGNTAAKAADGSTASRWCANNGDTGQWLKVDLGSEKSLTGTRIVWESAATNYRYRIEGSTDNTNWTTLADLTATTGTIGTSQVQVTVFRAQARYVPNSDGSFRLVNVRNGWRADVKDASTADGPRSSGGLPPAGPTRTGRSSHSEGPAPAQRCPGHGAPFLRRG